MQVKYLTKDEIERDANALLLEFADARGVDPAPPIPIEDIVEKHLRLSIDFDDLHELLEAPQTGPEPDILGAIWVDRREIYINSCLDPDAQAGAEGRFRFTLAHEGGGHWRLHRDYLLQGADQRALFDDTGSPSVICRTSQARERVEWQADYYASCLLMPKPIVMYIWQRRFGGLEPLVFEEERHTVQIAARRTGLRQIGRSLNASPYDDFANGWADYFASMFKVSRQAMRIRLEELGLLRRSRGLQNDIFRAA